MAGRPPREAVPEERVHLWLMLLLTFGTGVVDAVGYLGLDKVFTGNMTGNVVILGMALTGADGLPVLGPVLALLGFMVGAAVGGRVLKDVRGAWTPRTTALLAIVTAVMLTLAALLLATGEVPSHRMAVTTTTLLGAAMGLQAATARVISVKDVTTVVVTSTITGLAADSTFGSGKARRSGGAGSTRRLAAVLLILAGAAAGALLLKWHIGAGLALAGAIALVATVVGGTHAKRGAGALQHARVSA